jgi:hypothetical protein
VGGRTWLRKNSIPAGARAAGDLMGATVAAEGRTILLFKFRPFDSCAAHFYLVLSAFRIFSAPLVGVSLLAEQFHLFGRIKEMLAR